jgi:DNA-binding transcriptional MerR regulator
MTAAAAAMITTTDRPLRIGEVAAVTGTTPRTIRYYEEIGLLPGTADRAQGKHRCYTHSDVERINEIIRLRDLLGLSLEQLSTLLAAQTARAEIKRAYQQTDDPTRRRDLLGRSLELISTQLELVSGRRRELEQFEQELLDKRELVEDRLRELSE